MASLQAWVSRRPGSVTVFPLRFLHWHDNHSSHGSPTRSPQAWAVILTRGVRRQVQAQCQRGPGHGHSLQHQPHCLRVTGRL
eukprot:1268408-Rhodomonas_salina.1